MRITNHFSCLREDSRVDGFEANFPNNKAHLEELLMMRESGRVVNARAVKEAARMMELGDLNQLVEEPTILLVPSMELFKAREDVIHTCLTRFERERDETKFIPRSVQMTRDVVLCFGPTDGCKTCRGLLWELRHSTSYTTGKNAENFWFTENKRCKLWTSCGTSTDRSQSVRRRRHQVNQQAERSDQLRTEHSQPAQTRTENMMNDDTETTFAHVCNAPVSKKTCDLKLDGVGVRMWTMLARRQTKHLVGCSSYDAGTAKTWDNRLASFWNWSMSSSNASRYVLILELPVTPSGWLDWEVHEHEVDQCMYGVIGLWRERSGLCTKADLAVDQLEYESILREEEVLPLSQAYGPDGRPKKKDTGALTKFCEAVLDRLDPEVKHLEIPSRSCLAGVKMEDLHV